MKKYITLLLFILIFSKCTENFVETNSNPNQPEEVTSDLLLSTVLSTLANRTATTGWNSGNIVAQLSAKINFTGFDRYSWGTESGLWNEYYGILPEIQIILETAQSEQNKNKSLEGIALIMRSFVFSAITDNWGNVPFKEAIKGNTGNFTPIYDNQEDIYNVLLDDLKKAEELLKSGAPIIGGDIIYGGNIEKWRKFANSLRLRYLLRVSSKKNVSSEIQSILNSGVFIASNEDNALMVYPATTTIDSWPVSRSRVGSFDEFRMSKTVQKILEQFNDNRKNAWYQPTDNPDDDPTLFSGLPNGLSEDNASNFNGGASNVSRFKKSFFFDSFNSVKAAMMQAAEVHFIFAEAIQRGIISGNASSFYNEGIRLSFEYWNVNQDINAYLSQSGVVYDGKLETIMTQKWLASMLVGFEAWYDFRRTGLPSFIIPGQDNVNNNRVPVRFLYPDSEQTLNADNFKAAISSLGGKDDINIKGWWEK